MIDTHQHFWRLSRGGYGWMPEDMPALKRDYEPSDLQPLLRECGITGTVAVQADDNVAETRFLLSLADENPWILGVVGWVDLEAADAPEQIRALSAHPAFVGIRPMIQDIADDGWMLNPKLAPGLAALSGLDLTFDALVLERHLPNLARFLGLYPDLRVVIDHCAKPEMETGRFENWASGMAECAASPNSFCKISGLLTEAAPGAGLQEVVPYIEHAAEVFGPSRLLFGSDWPVLNLVSDYKAWTGMLRQHFSSEPETLTRQMGTESAMKAYPRLRRAVA